MKFMKIASGIVALSMAAAMLNGCSYKSSENIVFDSGQEKKQEQINLTFFGYKYEALNVMAIEDSLHGFMDEYPDISITYDGIKSPQYFDVLDKRINTHNGDDIFMVDHERVLELEGKGKLTDLSDISTLDNFSDLAKSQITAHGVIDYLPTSISAFGLYCNLDLLKEHNQRIPTNLAEFEDVCNYFVSIGITPIIANNDISLKTIAIAKSMLPIYEREDSVQVLKNFSNDHESLSKTFLPGFAFVEQMLKQGWIDSDKTLNTAKTKDDLIIFARGEQPFMLTGVWAVPRLYELEPDFEFEVSPYPIMEDGSVLVINIDTRISINSDSQYQDEAKKFVEYLTRDDVMWEFVDSQSSFSPLKDNRLSNEKSIQSISPYLTNGRSVIGSDDNLEFPIWDITRKCIVEMLNGFNSDEAVSYMENLLDEWKNQQEPR